MNVGSILAMVSGLWASFLWWQASRFEMPFTSPPTASVSDAPELHILDAQVELNNLIQAYKQSSTLNKRAALWTAISILLAATAPLSPSI
jgi:hypothetical protein